MTTTNTPQIDREALRREGWQVIETEEEKRRFFPRDEGDEYFSERTNLWFQVDPELNGFASTLTYRRRIPAPVGDQWSANDVTKRDKNGDPLSLGAQLAVKTFHAADAYPQLTKPAAAPASGWVSTKDRLPTEADANSDGCVYWANPKYSVAQCDAWDIPSGATHWTTCPDIPPLPEPVKPTPTQEEQDETAFNEWYGKLNNYGEAVKLSARAAYLAGLRAERARGKGAV